MFYEPLPSVRRVVFISTPHRGCYLVSSFVLSTWCASSSALPVTLVRASTNRQQNPDVLRRGRCRRPGQHASRQPLPAEARRSRPPAVTAHSIVAVTATGRSRRADDGVVKYESAHIDGVESEKVVRSSHSTQGTRRRSTR